MHAPVASPPTAVTVAQKVVPVPALSGHVPSHGIEQAPAPSSPPRQYASGWKSHGVSSVHAVPTQAVLGSWPFSSGNTSGSSTLANE
jgi:hypothetical protein